MFLRSYRHNCNQTSKTYVATSSSRKKPRLSLNSVVPVGTYFKKGKPSQATKWSSLNKNKRRIEVRVKTQAKKMRQITLGHSSSCRRKYLLKLDKAWIVLLYSFKCTSHFFLSLTWVEFDHDRPAYDQLEEIIGILSPGWGDGRHSVLIWKSEL